MFKRLFAIFALVCAGVAQAGVSIEHWQTREGTRVYFVHSPSLPILDVQVDFVAGSMFDPQGKAGVSDLTRALLDLGAGDLDETEIANQLADVGAQLGGSSDMDRASVSLRTLSQPEKREAALALMIKVLGQPRFEAGVFQREQTRAISGLKDSLTRPDVLAGRAFWQTLYPDHPYGVQNTAESLSAIRVEDLRQFWSRYYNRNNGIVTIVGDVSRAEAEAIAQRIVVVLPAGEPAVLPPPPVAGEGKTVNIAHSAAQSHIYLGMPSVARGDPDIFPLVVGNYVLGGGGFVSRLMEEVREKRGFAYSVYSYFAPMKQYGPFQIGLQTKRAQSGEALKVVHQVLQDFLEKGVTPSELAAAKANLVGSFPLRLDSNSKIMSHVAMMGFYGLPMDYLDTYQARIQAVTAEDIRRAFAKHVRLQGLATIVVAGD